MPSGEEDRATAFYEGLLGVPRVPKPAHLAARGGCWFERGQLKIHLGVEADFRPARKAHIALVVSDLTSLAKRLADAGAPVVDDRPLDGYRRSYTDDPFGNRIELIEQARVDDVSPPDCIDADAVTLRRLRPSDASALSRLVADNLDHLRPWMPWATADAASVAGQREFTER